MTDDTKTNPDADPPTPVQLLAAVLPDHAAIGGGLFSWSAQWTTPQGLWQIEKQTTFLKVEPLTLVGPGIKIVTSDIDLIITVLRHQNAIELERQRNE